MKKLTLLLSLSLALFADKVDPSVKETQVLEETNSYTVLCIRGYEYILDYQGTISQSFMRETYNVTGVGSIPVQSPIRCQKETK